MLMTFATWKIDVFLAFRRIGKAAGVHGWFNKYSNCFDWNVLECWWNFDWSLWCERANAPSSVSSQSEVRTTKAPNENPSFRLNETLKLAFSLWFQSTSDIRTDEINLVWTHSWFVQAHVDGIGIAARTTMNALQFVSNESNWTAECRGQRGMSCK